MDIISKISKRTYTVGQQIASGTGTIVSEGVCRTDNTQVIIKQIPIDESTEERFKRERNANEILSNYPHFVKCIDVAVGKKMSYLVMEYLESRDLEYFAESYKRRGTFMDQNIALKITLDILQALKCLKKHNLFHRDIKPSNILITKEKARLLDMSIVTSPDWNIITVTASSPGSLSFQPRGITSEDMRIYGYNSDIYSLGCTLYYILTNQYVDTKKSWLLNKKVIVPPTSIVKNIKKEVEKIILRMLLPINKSHFPSIEEIEVSILSVLTQDVSMTPFFEKHVENNPLGISRR